MQNKKFSLYNKSIIKIRIKRTWLYCIKSRNIARLQNNSKLKFFTIIGSRRIILPQILRTKVKLRFLLKINKKVIISGGAKGADTLAEHFAYKHNIFFIKILPALYIDKRPNFIEKYKHKNLICSPKLKIKGKQIKYALLHRNKTLSELADFIISLSTPKYSGTSYTLLYALIANKPIYFIKSLHNNSGANFLYKHNIGTFC